ncbi:pentatricopeptide repeat-containing protein At2g35130-like [Asparagus officinalis]|nr:pentatricopeptide repeat-containing protein At2g35130-like [Asparagus officinalis]
MITVLANNGLKEKVEQICSYLKKECLEPDTEGFNMLLRTLLNFGFNNTAMDCFRLMKLWESEPDESTFRILINGLESNGELDLLLSVKDEAEKYFDGNLEFLEEGEQLILNEV